MTTDTVERVAAPTGVVHGRTAPRLSTSATQKITPATSLGFEVIAWAEQTLGWHPLPWQRYWLTHALQLHPDGSGRLLYKRFLLMIGRQSGKSSVISILALWTLSQRRRNVLYSSTTIDTSKEQFELAGGMAEDAPEQFGGTVKLRYSTGQYAIECPNIRVKYKVVSANRRGGRGLSRVGLVAVDELREMDSFDPMAAIESTTLSVDDSLIVMASNAGDRNSVVLNHWRQIGMDGSDPDLYYAEWSAPDGCELDDVSAIRQANPALGYTIQLRNILALIKGPASVFRTENLCQTIPSLNAAVEPAAWDLCSDPQPIKDRTRVALGIDISPDLRHATVVAAVTGTDLRTRVETVAVYESASELRQALPELLRRVKPRAVGWYPSGPASALAADLKTIKRGHEISGPAITSACMALAEQITSGRLAHNGDEMLTTQILGAARLRVGDGWKFGRQGDSPVDAAYAVAAAVMLARQIPTAGRLSLVTAAADKTVVNNSGGSSGPRS